MMMGDGGDVRAFVSVTCRLYEGLSFIVYIKYCCICCFAVNVYIAAALLLSESHLLICVNTAAGWSLRTEHNSSVVLSTCCLYTAHVHSIYCHIHCRCHGSFAVLRSFQPLLGIRTAQYNLQGSSNTDSEVCQSLPYLSTGFQYS